MQPNGVAYFIDALSASLRREYSITAQEGDDELAYTDGNLIEHILPPRPKTNDLKAALTEDMLLELETKPRLASTLTRLKKEATPDKMLCEFLRANDFDLSHADDPALAARDAQAFMRRLAPRESVFCSITSKRDTSGKSFMRMPNAFGGLINSASFPIYIKDEFEPAMVAFLTSRHDEDVLDEFKNTLAMFAREEQRCEERENREQTEQATAEKSAARVEMLAYLLAVALCGKPGVRALSLDQQARADIATRYHTRNAPASKRTGHDACLVEQLLDEQGNVAFGTTTYLARGVRLNIGRAPVAADDEAMLAVRYVAEDIGSEVGRMHAAIAYDEATNCWNVTDLNSLNGTALAHLADTDQGESFQRAVLLEPGETMPLSSGDVLFFAPAQYPGNVLGPNPFGATFRFAIL